MNNNFLISFIIPAFNEEKRLPICIEKIIEQNKSGETEIVLVDDGSSDATYQLMQEYEKRYSFISTFHIEKNMGLSHARNVGLEHVSGKYIWFVDADDYIAEDSIAQLREIIVNSREELDCLFFFWYRVMDDYIYPTPQFEELRSISPDTVFTGQELFREMAKYTERFVDGVCRCIINRTFIEKHRLRFVEGSTYEDGMFAINIFLKAKYVRCINKLYYYYTNNMDSWTHRMNTAYNYACAFVELVYFFRIGVQEINDRSFRAVYEKYLRRYIEDMNNLRNKMQPSDEPLLIIERIDPTAAFFYKIFFEKKEETENKKKIRELLIDRTEKKLIIYGAGQRARECAEIIDGLNKQILFYLVSDEYSQEKYPQNPSFIYGVPVKTISELYDNYTDIPVLVTVRSVHQERVKNILLEKGMKRIIIIDI